MIPFTWDSRKDLPVVIESKPVISKGQGWGKELTVKEGKGTAFGDKVFYIMIMMMLTWLDTFFKTHRITLENWEILTMQILPQ